MGGEPASDRALALRTLSHLQVEVAAGTNFLAFSFAFAIVNPVEWHIRFSRFHRQIPFLANATMLFPPTMFFPCGREVSTAAIGS